MHRTLILQLLDLLLNHAVAGFFHTENSSPRYSSTDISTETSKQLPSSSHIETPYETFCRKHRLDTLESHQTARLLYQLVSRLQRQTLTVIHDSEEESTVSLLSDILAFDGITTNLYTYTGDMSSVFITLPPEQLFLTLCSASCTADVLEQGSFFAAQFQNASLMRHSSKWLVYRRHENSSQYRMSPPILHDDRHDPTLHRDENLTSNLHIGLLGNVAVIVVSPPGDGDRLTQTSQQRPMEVYTSLWGAKGWYWKEIPIDFSRPSLTDILYPNIRSGYNGKTFTVGTLPWPPFIIKTNGKYSGFCVDILDILSHRLNFTYVFVEPKDRKYGIEENQTWSGLMGQLWKVEVDMVVTDIIITQERENVADFTYPFLMDTAKIVVRRSTEKQGRVWTYIHPLKPEVYLCVAATFLVVLSTVVSMEIYRRGQAPEERHHRVVDFFWYLLGVLCRQGDDFQFARISVRPIVGGWWVLTFLVTAVYTGNLIAFLTVNNDDPPFDTALQMATQTDFKWGCVRGASYLNLFKHSNLTIHKHLLEGIVRFNKSDPDILSADQDIHFRKLLTEDYAYIGGQPVITYWMSQSCVLRTLEDSFFPVKYSMGFPQGSAYKDVFSEMILQLVNSGVIDRLKQSWWPKNSCSQEEKTRQEAVTLVDAQAAFYSALSGVALGSIVLIIERCWKRQSLIVRKR